MKTKSSSPRRGLLAGGNWIIDQVKIIDVYPQPEKLGNILSQSQGTGGGPYNVLQVMAQSAIDKISPGPKLDELTAEKVFGWKNVHKHEGALVGKK